MNKEQVGEIMWDVVMANVQAELLRSVQRKAWLGGFWKGETGTLWQEFHLKALATLNVRMLPAEEGEDVPPYLDVYVPLLSRSRMFELGKLYDEDGELEVGALDALAEMSRELVRWVMDCVERQMHVEGGDRG